MKPRWASFARFLFSGGINTAFGYLSYAALVLSGLPLWLAVAGSTVLAIIFNFYSYGGLVFRQTSRRYMPRFLAFYLVLGLANYLSLKLLSHFGIGPLIAQAILVPLLAIAGYVGMRHLVFGQRGALEP